MAPAHTRGAGPRHRRTGDRNQAVYPTFSLGEQAWTSAVPAGHTSYARHVGRIGALAVALGVGAALAAGHGAGVARADESSDSPSDAPPSASTANAATGGATPAAPPATPSPGSSSAGHAEQTSQPTVPEMNVGSSGGAHTSSAGVKKPRRTIAVDEPTVAARQHLSTPRRAKSTDSAPSSATTGPATNSDGAATPKDVKPASSVATTQAAPAAPAPAAAAVTTALASASSPVDTPVPAAPAEPTPSPVALAALAWTRRDSQRSAVSIQTASAAAVVASASAPPQPYNDIYSTEINTPVGGDVLTNDVDHSAGPLVVDSYTDPTHGTVVWTTNSAFVYSPDRDYIGYDQFFYTVRDGNGATADTVVSFAVLVPNQPPIARPDTYQTPNDRTLTGAVLYNDGDPDGPSPNLVVDSHTTPASGVVSIGTDGFFSYTPAVGFVGVDAFDYTAMDIRGGKTTATVTITVTASTTATHAVDDYATTLPNTPVTIDVLANDFGSDGGSLAGRAVTPTQPAFGTVTVNADGTLTYTPAQGFFGDDPFTYSVTDGIGVSGTGTVNVRVVNDPPNSAGDVYSTQQGYDLVVDADRGVLSNDADSDGSAIAVVSFGRPSHGTVTVSPDGSFAYHPDAGYVGEDGFSYSVADALGATSTARVYLYVTAIPNLPPVANDGAWDAVANTTTTITPWAYDPEGAPLTTIVVGQPVNGSLTINADGTFDYTPMKDFVGSDVFSYQVSDGVHTAAAMVTITVLPENRAPIAVDDTVTFANGEQVIVHPLANDVDPDGDPIYLVDYGTPGHGSLGGAPDYGIEYSPDPDFVGTDSFTYTVSDSAGNSSTATIFVTILPPHHPPTANDDTATTKSDTPIVVDVLANDVDPDGDPLTVEVDGQPYHGTVVVQKNGSLLYTPDKGYAGVDYLSYTVTDSDGQSAYASVAITVTGDDGGWVEPDHKSYTVAGNTTLKVTAAQGLLAGDADHVGWLAGVDTKPSHGTLRLNQDGSFSYTPATGFTGRDTFAYYVHTARQGDGPYYVDVDVTPASGPVEQPTTGIQVANGTGGGGAAPVCTSSRFPIADAPGGTWPTCWSIEATKPSDRL